MFEALINRHTSPGQRALAVLRRVHKRVDNMNTKFIEIDSDELMIEKNIWETAKANFAIGAKIMGLTSKSESKSCLIYFFPNGHTTPHKHPGEFVGLRVIEGQITDTITGKSYKEGDIVTFNINEVYRLQSLKESYIYIIFSKSEQPLKDLNSADKIKYLKTEHYGNI